MKETASSAGVPRHIMRGTLKDIHEKMGDKQPLKLNEDHDETVWAYHTSHSFDTHKVQTHLVNHGWTQTGKTGHGRHFKKGKLGLTVSKTSMTVVHPKPEHASPKMHPGMKSLGAILKHHGYIAKDRGHFSHPDGHSARLERGRQNKVHLYTPGGAASGGNQGTHTNPTNLHKHLSKVHGTETAAAKWVHPHQSFIDEADKHLAHGPWAIHHAEGHHSKPLKGVKTIPRHIHNSNVKTADRDNDIDHSHNEAKAKGLHKIAKKHGFEPWERKPNVYTHPKTGATLNIHHPLKQVHERFGGYALLTPTKKHETAATEKTPREHFVDHAAHIAKKKVEHHKVGFDHKDLPRAVHQAMMSMALEHGNPNLEQQKKFLPKRYDKKLYDNGEGNKYDSEWFKNNDAKMHTIVKQGIAKAKKEAGETAFFNPKNLLKPKRRNSTPAHLVLDAHGFKQDKRDKHTYHHPTGHIVHVHPHGETIVHSTPDAKIHKYDGAKALWHALRTHHAEVGSVEASYEEVVEAGGKPKLIQSYQDKHRVAKVYHNKEWDEHQVKFYEHGRHLPNADYHTDDKEDAHDTAKNWLKGVHSKEEEADMKQEIAAPRRIAATGEYQKAMTGHVLRSLKSEGMAVGRTSHAANRSSIPHNEVHADVVKGLKKHGWKDTGTGMGSAVVMRHPDKKHVKLAVTPKSVHVYHMPSGHKAQIDTHSGVDHKGNRHGGNGKEGSIWARVEEVAKPFDHDRYQWHTFKGKRGVTLHYRGKPHTMLRSGMRFATRPSSNGQHTRLITEANGKNIVHTISHEHAERLHARSRVVRSDAGVRKPTRAPEKRVEQHKPPKVAKPAAGLEVRFKSKAALREHLSKAKKPVAKEHKKGKLPNLK